MQHADNKETNIYMGKLNAVLVGLITPNQNEERTKEYLDELAFLADTNNTNCVKRFVQRLDSPNTSTYVGEGKLQEINQYVQQFADTDDFIDMVIFDDELSPRQLRNIEKALNAHNQNDIKNNHKQPVRVIDRTILILEIFLNRAQTSYAKTQVVMPNMQQRHVLSGFKNSLKKMVKVVMQYLVFLVVRIQVLLQHYLLRHLEKIV